MKAIYFEEHAARYLAQASTFQSGEFDDAIELVHYIRSGEDATIKQLNCITNKNVGFICNRTQTSLLRALIVDIEKMKALLEYDDNSLVTIILKIIKFTIKRWDNIQVSDSEKFIDNNHAILFPFPYSEKHPIKVLVNLSPAPDFTAKREMSYIYAAGIGEGQFDIYYNDILNLRAIRDDAAAVFSKNAKVTKKKNQDIDSLQVTELSDINKKMMGFMDFEKWMHYLSTRQIEFVKKDLRGSERLEGAAGTGKTVTLVLRALYLCKLYNSRSEDFHAIFICHSVASKDYLKLLFESTSDNPHVLDSNYSQQSITLTTLQEWCTEYLGNKIGRSEVLDEDAQESKDLQFRFVSDAYSQCYEGDFISYRDSCSEEFVKFIEDNDKAYVVEKLCSEISITIKGRAEQDYEIYKNLPRLQESIPVAVESDFLFVYLVYEKYQSMLSELGYFDNDDISLSSHAQLETPIWRRRRSERGYDVVFVDELHLFSYNELSIFHLLARDEKKPHLIYAVDKTQAIGDRGLTKETIEDSLKIKEEISTRYNTIFRSSPQIVDLAFSILSSGAELFLNFENPLDKIMFSFNIAEEKKALSPEYILFPSDEAMVLSVFSKVDDLSLRLGCTRDRILIVVTERSLLSIIIKQGEKMKKPFEQLVRRGDYTTITKAEKHNRYVIGYIDYIGGLEFDAVVIVGVDKGRVPQVTSSESKIYLNYEWHNRMYVAITRAKYAVSIMGNKSRTVSTLLQNAIAHERISVVEK
jgi:superfamily I DNA/RNA helicase